MSLRWKFALAMAAIAAFTAVVFGTASYRSTRDRLYAEIDRSLSSVDDRRFGAEGLPDRGPLAGYEAQIIGPAGAVRETTFTVAIPVTEADVCVDRTA